MNMSEYIKKEDAIRHFQSFEKIMKSMPLADVKARLKDLPTYSFPDSENKGDLISRQAVLDELKKWDWQELYLPIHFKQILDDVSSADVRPNIHGHWGRRIVDNGFNADWVCSECGHREYTDFIHMNFCPNCGADMREPKDILHKTIDNTTFAEEAYPNIKEELHKAVDAAEPIGEKGGDT